MPSPVRLTYKSPETFEPYSEQEKKDASAKITALIKAKKSCANCKASCRNGPWLTCSLKANKRIQAYNICIHHKPA